MATTTADTKSHELAERYRLPEAHRALILQTLEEIYDTPNRVVRQKRLAAFEKLVKNQKYLVEKAVGKGAFGSVYVAHRRDSADKVAVKIIDLEATEDDITTIYREIMALSEGDICDQLCRYIDSQISGTRLWIVMEYMSGGSVLDSVRRLNGLDEQSVSIIAREILLGMRFLWSGKKIHRDIKCANVLLTKEGNVKLADFGASRTLSTTVKAQDITMIGSPFWMAPEVFQGTIKHGEEYKCDIWSLGITCIEMVQGHAPYQKTVHPIRAAQMICSKEPPKLPGDKGLSATFHTFISLCLQKDISKRATIDELLKTPFIKNSRQREYLATSLFSGMTDDDEKAST